MQHIFIEYDKSYLWMENVTAKNQPPVQIRTEGHFECVFSRGYQKIIGGDKRRGGGGGVGVICVI
jgi:hypothetical protein